MMMMIITCLPGAHITTFISQVQYLMSLTCTPIAVTKNNIINNLWLTIKIAHTRIKLTNREIRPTSNRGVATDGGISVYIPPNQSRSTLNFLRGCFVSLTQDKFDIVPVTSDYS